LSNLPWNEPGFSQRMLSEHLSQEHDAASRRFETIDRHVAWIHEHVLGGRPSRILDLCCGPGLYLQRLVALGHDGVGVDFGPAAIAHARQQAEATGLDIHYQLEDVRGADFGSDYGLVMMIWGEFNVFPRSQALDLVRRCGVALRPGGRLVLEVHTFDAVRRIGQAPPSREASDSGLFLDRPHTCEQINTWDAGAAVAGVTWTVTDSATRERTVHEVSYQAYTQAGYVDLLQEAGFVAVSYAPSLVGAPDESSDDVFVLVASYPA
jgi:SAM-dependent methyltransferase